MVDCLKQVVSPDPAMMGGGRHTLQIHSLKPPEVASLVICLTYYVTLTCTRHAARALTRRMTAGGIRPWVRC